MQKTQIKATSPKYRLLNTPTLNKTSSTLSLKDNKIHMKSMQLQLERSRIAVEHITTFRNTEQHLKKKINQIQNQLHQCIVKIDSQNKRQKVLADLISILKGQMFKFQAKQKAQQQMHSYQYQKKIKKVEYDIEQILQKHNQQIAKISLLKEQANGSRSQRVVYSNLFKKLQSQIKQYQQTYKQELLKTQAVMMKKSKQSSSLQGCFSKFLKPNYDNVFSVESSLRNINNECIETNKRYEKNCSFKQSSNIYSQNRQALTNSNNPTVKNSKISSKSQQIVKANNNQGNNLFITSTYQGNKDSQHQSQTFSEKRKSYDHNKTSFSHQSMTNFKNTLASISQFQRQIQKLKIYGGCDSVIELIQHYSNLQQQNNQLLYAIELLNSQIGLIREQKNKASNEINQKEFAVKALRGSAFLLFFELTKPPNTESKDKIFTSKKKSTYCKEIVKVQESQQQRHLNQIGNILRLFGIQQQNSDKISNQSLQKLDWKIDCLLLQTKQVSKKYNQKYPFVTSEIQQTLNSQVLVECLLDRMQKFNDCEKILDKTSFQNQYFKEINRGKKSIRNKKNTQK